MSKADKMRGRLATIQKDREDFERQKKELEADMNVGRHNMSKINKGLRNNVILEEPIVVDAQKSHNHHHHHNGRASGGSHTNVHSNGANATNTPKYGHPDPFFTGSQNMSNSSTIQSVGANASGATGGTNCSQLNIMPSGPRVSDWCYSAPLDSPAPPQVKSRELYENVRLLGRGSFGEVILVKNVEDNKLFAIKTQLCPKDSEFYNVLREVRFLRTCRHPCIIDVHDAFLINNPRIVYIVMHYCESGTISGVISSARKNKSNLAESQIVKWVLQLALAMQYLHDNHVVHRDLKPMNVMLTEGGDSLKLADFGLAMSMAEKSEEENTDEAGTPYYTAPEMIQQQPYSYPADCWSFGVIVHQLLALERPFDGSSTADLVKSILSGEIPPLPVHYSDDIKLISRELLRKDQTERLTMTELLLEPMFCSKLASFPQNYRPRTLEERIRRHHQKQLEAQMEGLNRIRKAEGYKSLHERVALRVQAEEAALAAATAANDLNLLTSTADAAGSAEPSTHTKSHSVSRHSASAPVTTAPTRDGSPTLTSALEGSGSLLQSQDTNCAVSRAASGLLDTSVDNNPSSQTATSSTTNHTASSVIHASNSSSNTQRRHTEQPSVLSDELETYIRTSRSNVEDVVHPGEHINISPNHGSSTSSSVIRKSSAGNMEGGSPTDNNTNTSYSVTSSPTKDRPKLAPVDESFSSKTTSVRIDPTAVVNIIDGENQDATVLGTATDSTLSSGAAGESTLSDSTNAVEESNGTNDNSNEFTAQGEDKNSESDVLPVVSRPTTPYGGRKGQELQRAIENDQVYSVLSEQDVAVESASVTSPIQQIAQDNESNVNDDKGVQSPSTRTHSFETKSALAEVHSEQAAV